MADQRGRHQPGDSREEQRRARPRLRPIVLGSVMVASALALAACGGPSTPGVASLGGGHGTRTTTTVPTGNATALVDQWATCMQHHGDPDQADPTIDSHGGINIVIPTSVSTHQLGEDLHNVSGVCSEYLAAAQRVLRLQMPYTPFNPDNAIIVQYANCMRMNGVANYPYPVGGESNLLGINMNSPTFVRANIVCGKQINAPAWWINGWGPPGDVSSSSGPVGLLNGNQPNQPRRSPPVTANG